jgi:hypothetical protein
MDNVEAISRRVAPSRLLSINSTTKPKSTSIPKPKSTSTSQLQENIPTARFAANSSFIGGTTYTAGTGMGSLSGISHFTTSPL